MSDVMVSTRSAPLLKTNGSDSTTAGTSIANPAASATPPSGDGVIALGHAGAEAPNGLLVLPYGTNGNAQTFLMAVYAWDLLRGDQSVGQKDLWVAFLLAQFTCTLNSALTGLANSQVDASHFFCDTITLTAGNANVSVEVVSPGTNRIAHVVADVKGCRYASVLFAMNSSAASANALARRL